MRGDTAYPVEMQGSARKGGGFERRTVGAVFSEIDPAEKAALLEMY